MAKPHPPKPRLTLRVGITGHRPNRLAEGAEGRLRDGIKDLFQGIQSALEEIRGNNRDLVADEAAEVRAVSPLAEGSDRIFAQAARDLGLGLYAPLPFAQSEYERDFADEASRITFRKLAADATVFEFTHAREDQDLAYESVGLFTLRQCDLLIAVWNGEEGQGRGGTQEIIAAAVAAGVPIVRFDEKGDGPWILPWPSRRVTGAARDLLKGAIPATQAAIATLIESIVAPPTDEERRRLSKFFGETERLRNLWFGYPLLQRLLTPWRQFRQALFPQPYVASTRADWRRDFWAPLAGAGDDDVSREAPGKLAPKGVMGLLEERTAWADKLAVHFAQIYRSSYVFIFMLGALTVACALLPVLFPTKPYSTIVEFTLIALATGIVVGGSRLNWHRRWLDYRQLAERLRMLRLLALTGSNASRFRVEHGPDEDGDHARGWTDWYVRMTVREVGMPHGRADGAYAAAIRRALAEGEIKSQIAFHTANARRQHDMEHRLDTIGVWLFAVTTAMLIGYLELYVLDWLAGGHRHSAAPFANLVTFFSALFPSFGAALFAIRVQGDFDESARLSNEMTARLKTLEAEVARQGEASFAAMSRLVEEAASAMTADLSDWQLLYRGKPLTLAG